MSAHPAAVAPVVAIASQEADPAAEAGLGAKVVEEVVKAVVVPAAIVVATGEVTVAGAPMVLQKSTWKS